jgi:hypothetical protein
MWHSTRNAKDTLKVHVEQQCRQANWQRQIAGLDGVARGGEPWGSGGSSVCSGSSHLCGRLDCQRPLLGGAVRCFNRGVGGGGLSRHKAKEYHGAK